MFELAPFALDSGYAESILPLADVKAHVGVDATDDYHDDLLGALRDAAVDMVEKYCSLRLAPVTGLKWRAECLPARLVLGTGPVTAITAITWLDSTGATITGDASTLRVATGGVVVPKPGQTWPSTIAAGIEITFSAGFEAEERPAALVQAAKMFAAHLFANREAVAVTGQIAGEIPLGFRALCNTYRMPVI